MILRCPECRTRRATRGLFTKHLRDSGHKLCHCGGYHFAHRPGSPYCVSNPRSPVLLAIRYGADADELLDIAIDVALHAPAPRRRIAADCPF